jgi:hypothetical protein
VARGMPWLRRQLTISTHYPRAEVRRVRSGGWLRQERAYARLFEEVKAGSPWVDFVVAEEAIDVLGRLLRAFRQVGCGSGYYSEVLATLAKSAVRDTGVDARNVAIPMAVSRSGTRREWPMATYRRFQRCQSDAHSRLSEGHRQKCTGAEVSCIFHSVPVFPSYSTVHIHKYVYGSPVVEIVFSRAGLLGCFQRMDCRSRGVG